MSVNLRCYIKGTEKEIYLYQTPSYITEMALYKPKKGSKNPMNPKNLKKRHYLDTLYIYILWVKEKYLSGPMDPEESKEWERDIKEHEKLLIGSAKKHGLEFWAI